MVMIAREEIDGVGKRRWSTFPGAKGGNRGAVGMDVPERQRIPEAGGPS